MPFLMRVLYSGVVAMCQGLRRHFEFSHDFQVSIFRDNSSSNRQRFFFNNYHINIVRLSWWLKNVLVFTLSLQSKYLTFYDMNETYSIARIFSQ